MVQLDRDQDPLAAVSDIRRMLADGTRFAVPGARPSAQADVVLRTSGSSATAKSVGHTFESIDWSAQTSRRVLTDPGWRWLLLLSPFSAGGLATAARSEQEPAVWPGAGRGFTAAEVVDWYDGSAQATSMVSTQLSRLLELPAGVTLLQSMEVVLIGGGPLRAALRRRCEELDIPAISTYGATETLGGCVYDGVAWPGLQVQIVEDQIHLEGPNLARCYVPGPEIPRPWPTGDLGTWSPEGRLQVLGRADDMVTVKGVNRHLWEYEQQALAEPGVVEAVAVAVPDDADGYRVVVFVEDDQHRLPRLESGKPDRRELLRRASGHSQ